jgi:hypothetical protein
MLRTICVAAGLLLAACSAYAQAPIQLAYVPPAEWQSPGPTSTVAACVFLGSYESGGFLPAAELRSAPPDFDEAFATSIAAFSAGEGLLAVGPAGQRFNVTVDRVDPGATNAVGAPSLVIRVPTRPTLREGAWLMTSNVPLRILPRRPARLDAAAKSLFRARARELWDRHLSERPPDERPLRYRLRNPIVERVDALPGVITVRIPMDIEERNPKGGKARTIHDERGQMFFVYSTETRRIIREEFGHPEWSQHSTVRTIKPWMFLQAGSNNAVFFVGQNSAGWESDEVALFDLRTGREVLTCW